ncbi:hypothetical protein EV122DRAFT_288694 [Schizophyllum commune]
MGTRRQVVPASLHSELTEYSSLIRALHANSTLDVTSHLLPSAWKGKELATDYEDDEDDPQDEYVAPRTRSASRLSFERPSSASLAFPSSPPSRSRSRSSAAKRRAPRESWTRWPLPQGDIYVPEWTWEDEVAAIASQLLTQSRPPAAPSPVSPLASVLPKTQPDPTRQSSQATVSTTIEETSSEDSDEDDNSAPTLPQSQPQPPATQEDDAEDSDTAEDEEPLPPAYLSALSQDSATFMSQVLALLAAHTPLRPGSLQNRIGTLTWRNVIDILSVSGFPGVDGSLLRNMTTKLEKVYDPYDGSERAAQRADMRLHARPTDTRTTVDPRPSSSRVSPSQSASAPQPISTPRPPRDPLSELLDLPPMPPDWTLGTGPSVASPPKLRKRKSQTQLEPKVMKRRRIASAGGRKVSMGRKASGATGVKASASGKKVAVGKTKKKGAIAKDAMDVDGDEWQDEEEEEDANGLAAEGVDVDLTHEGDDLLPTSPRSLPPSSLPTSQPLPPTSQPLPPPSPLPTRRRYPSTLPSLSPTQSSFPSLSQVLDQHRAPSADDSVRGRCTANNSQPLPSPSTAAISHNSRAREEEVQNQLHLMDSDSDDDVPLARSPEPPAPSSRPRRGRRSTAGLGASAVSSDTHAEGVDEASETRPRAASKKRTTKRVSTKEGTAKRLTKAAASTPPEAAAGTEATAGPSSQAVVDDSPQVVVDDSSQAGAASSSGTTRRTTRSTPNARSTSTSKGKRKPRIVSAAVIEDSD